MRFIWPLEISRVTRDFYFKDRLYVGGQHAALDIIDPTGTLGKPVRAVADGIAHANPLDYYSGLNAYVEHADGWRSGYRHFSKHVLPVNVPTAVKQGQTIGLAGSTGVSTGPHLHFDLWNKQKLSPEAFAKVGWWAHDPYLYLGKEEDFMAALTEAEQRDFYNKVTDIYKVLFDDADGAGSGTAPRWSYWQVLMEQAAGGASADADAIADELARRLKE